MSWAIQIIVAVALTAGSVLFVNETHERKPTKPSAAVQQAAEQNKTMGHLSDSLRIVGACSVACSLVGGFTLITVTKLRKKGRQ